MIPELTVKNNSKNPIINWATEILPENLLWNAGFEVGEDRPNLNYSKSPVTGQTHGEQSFSSNAKYTGSLGYQLLDNSNGKGNHFLFPNTKSDNSKTTWTHLKNVIQSDMNLSMSVNIKASAGSKVAVTGQGGFEEKLLNWNSKLVKDVEPNSSWLYVNQLDPSWKIQSDGKTPQQQYKVFPDELDKEIKQDNYISEIDTKNKRIKLKYAPYRQMKAGETLRHRRWVDAFYMGTNNIESDTWKLYNFNTKVNNLPYYNPFVRGFSLIMSNHTKKYVYMDDLKLGYATKVRLYRDNVKIYEGYNSELNDTTSIDKNKPNAVSNIIADAQNTQTEKKVKFKFNPATDNGSFYNYNISAIDKNGVETPKSKTQRVEVKSGIKGYSYVINKSANTIPGDKINTTSTEIEYSVPLNEHGNYYLHIKAVDNEGNVSNTVHHKLEIPKLTAVPKPEENMIRLDWTDMKENTYKVYQKKPGSKEFQTISTTDLDKSKKVKVLNIYPVGSGDYNIPPQTNGNLDLAGKVEKSSASLKDWVENYGLGLISVESINQVDFNSNPNKYLKNSDGSFKYDVLAVGFWNIGETNQHLSDNSIEHIREFIQSGRGVLTGHHHMGIWDLNSGMNRLKDEFGIKFVTETDWDKSDTLTEIEKSKIDYMVPDKSKNRYSSRYWFNNNKVKSEKKGLLLNYPYNISEPGRTFSIPESHNANDFVTGDVWLSFVPGRGYGLNNNEPVKNITQLPDGTVGTKNSYLSTFNNTALIQTGHSGLTNGSLIATEDEKKILVNTLFYLNQLSNENYLNDKSGQDVTSPNKPSVLNYSFEEEFININLNKTEDNGSDYKYYIEAENKNGDKTTSNIAEANIKSGFKGYSYVIDNKEITEPDNKIETINTNLKIKASNNKVFIHIKAIDNVGNESETLHYKIEDLIAPTLEFKINPNEYTKENVLIDVTAQDNGSGVKEIILPSGQVVKGTKASFMATQNGAYSFIAIDKMNNKIVQVVTINNIDRKKPTVTISNNKHWTNKDVQIKINSND